MDDIKLINQSEKANNRFKALAILLVGLFLTAIASFYTKNEVETIARQEYISDCNEIRIKIASQMYSQAQLLRTGSSLFGVSDTVSRVMWKEFNDRLNLSDHLPGIQGFGYSMIVSREELKQHIERIRKEGFPGYSVRPNSERPVYTSIIYLEPFAGRNLRAFGYDMFSEPVRRRAMEMARDSNTAVLTGKVILVQETSENVQLGTLMYFPVYRRGMPVNTVDQRRNAIKGWVYSPYRMDDLMQGMLGRRDLIRPDRIHLQIYDDSLSAKNLIYDSQKNDTLNHNDLASRTISMPVGLSGKKWILLFTQSSAQQSFINATVLVVTVSGISISLLLLALTLSFFKSQAQSRQIALQLKSELEMSGERFKILLNSTAEAIYGIDLDGNCTFSNKSCLDMLGYESNEQLVGRNMHNLIHHTRVDGSNYEVEDCPVQLSFLNGIGAHVDDEVFWRADGSGFPAEYWSFPVFINGQIEGSVVTFFDITERKKSDQITREAIQDAQKANMAKSEFLSRMSHELRTPLNAILGFAQLMEMGELSPGHKKGVHYILNSGKHLLNLINEVLDISRIESGNMPLYLEQINLADFTAEIVETVKPLAREKQVKIQAETAGDGQIYVYTDRIKLKQIWINLLNNAIKYNRTEGSVIIKAESRINDATNEEIVRISFIDTGIGISSENLEKLFIPFERIGAEKGEAEGTGLGLAVVRKLVDAMGLRMGVESVLNEGTTFWVDLPLIDRQSGNADILSDKKEPESGEIRVKGTILYVEDKLSNIELVEEILISHRPGIRLIKTSQGRQTVSLAIENSPDLILLDLDLPDLHGSRVFESLQAEALTRNIPVIIVSADAMTPQVNRMLKSGVSHFLTKPLDIVSFLKVVDQWI